MSLKRKIVLSFFVSASIIALLFAYLYINFLEIKKEINFLEITDTIRSKSLQLRRYEKNYFLYAPEHASDESNTIYQYISELNNLLDTIKTPAVERTTSMRSLIQEYKGRFSKIEILVGVIAEESNRMKMMSSEYRKISRLIEANFLDKPKEDAAYLSLFSALSCGRHWHHAFHSWQNSKQAAYTDRTYREDRCWKLCP